MKHTEDKGIQQIVWHNDQRFEDFATHLVTNVHPELWVETGTHLGWTTHWLLSRFPWLKVRTVELSTDYYEKSKENLAEFGDRVQMECDYSREMLRRGLAEFAQMDPPPVFWLDAHWYQPPPLRDECRLLSHLDRYIILIDDFACKDPDFDGDGGEPFDWQTNCHEYVASILGPRCWRPNYVAQPGFKGYGLFLKGVKYEPPPWLKEQIL